MGTWKKAGVFLLAALVIAVSIPLCASARPVKAEETSHPSEKASESAAVPKQHIIPDFPIIYQYPELPTGCEVTALTMVMHFYDCDVSKIAMASGYLPATAPSFWYSGGKMHGPDMEFYFVGAPFSSEGIICGAGAICTAANRYFEDTGTRLTAKDITGSTPRQLYSLVDQGVPVVVWVTIGMVDHEDESVWYTSNGRRMSYGSNDHGAVLVGYGPTTVTIADPISGLVPYSRAQFEAVFRSRGSRCVIIQEQEPYKTGWYDVAGDAWYADAVAYCVDNGLMNGVGDKIFEPGGSVSRGMLATILYRMEGEPTVSGSNPFKDVQDGQWYTNGILLANTQKIASGYGNGEFGVNDPVSREQMVAMLWRYEGEPEATRGEDFYDEEDISPYARTAVDWAREAGIISGKSGNRFYPQASMTRAEVASVLRGYMLTKRPEEVDESEEPAGKGELLRSMEGFELAPDLNKWAKR